MAKTYVFEKAKRDIRDNYEINNKESYGSTMGFKKYLDKNNYKENKDYYIINTKANPFSKDKSKYNYEKNKKIDKIERDENKKLGLSVTFQNDK